MNAALYEARAACRATDPDLFYPTSAMTAAGREQIQLAKAYCAVCPVQPECLAKVLAGPAKWRDVGMVAGGRFFKAGPDMYDRTTPKESPTKRAARRAQARVWNEAIPHGSVGGYRQHGRLKTSPCDECRAAAAVDSKATRDRRRMARRNRSAVA